MSVDSTSTAQSEAGRSLTDRALDLTRLMTHAIWGPGVDRLIDYLDDNVAFASAYAQTYSYGKQAVVRDIGEAIANRMAAGPYEVRDERYNVKALGNDAFLATAQYSVFGGTGSSKPHRKMLGIVSSMVWIRTNDRRRLALVLCHNSERALVSQRRGSTLDAGERQIALRAHDTLGTTYWVMPSDIVYVKASRQYTEVYCTDRTLRLRGSFSNVCEQLGSHVVGIHRSYAVNPLYVTRMEGEMLYLETGDKLPVPARRVNEVRRLLGGE